MNQVAQVSSTRAAGASDQSPSLARALAAGALAGQASGLIMAVVVMAVFTLFLGKGPLFPVQVIGSTVYGEAGLQGFHLGAFLAGLVLHQAGPSLAWGLALGAAASALGARRGAALAVLSVVVGLLSQVVDVHLVVPAVMKALHGKDLWAENVPLLWSWAAHLVFGLGLMLYAPIESKLAQR